MPEGAKEGTIDNHPGIKPAMYVVRQDITHEIVARTRVRKIIM